jgi:hypothetical protein
MPIRFVCPGCKKNLSAKDEHAGKKLTCPACKKPLTVPRPSPAVKPAAPTAEGRPVPERLANGSPEDVEAAAAALLSDAPAAAPGEATTIEFTCDYCDAPISVPATEADKRIPCPECKRILKVPEAQKADPSNWRKADKHLPSAAKLPDEPAPEGAWGNLTRTVVSREALEEADAIVEPEEPVAARDRVFYWSRWAVAVAVPAAILLYGYRVYAANRERRAADAATAYARDPATLKQLGPARVASLNTLAGSYYLDARLPYSDAPLASDTGSAELGQDAFARALTLLQDADPRSSERDAALGDLALAMVELGGTREEERDKLRLNWQECLRRVRAALGSIYAPEAKLEAYRAVAGRLFERGQSEGALALASSAFSEAPGEKAAARAAGLLEYLGRSGDKTTVEKAGDGILKEYAAKEPPPLAAEVVTLAILLGKPPPPPGRLPQEDENAWIGEAEGLARKGLLPQARARALAAKTPRVRLRSLVAVGGVTKQGAEDLAAAGKAALADLPEPGREGWSLLRLVRLGAGAGLPEDLLGKVADAIQDPALRGRARLELLRARLAQSKGTVGTDAADGVDPQTTAGALARAELARHNARYDAAYFRTAESWPEPMGAFGTLGALRGALKQPD